MRARFALAAAILLASACTDVDLGTTGQEVIGGSITPEGEFPGVGALMYDDFGQGAVAGCTGTLIAPDAVLTAAHCVDPDLIGDIVPGFTLAHDTTTGPPVIVAGREAIPHEMFDIGSNPGPGLAQFYDVAVLLLAAPITEVAPIKLPPRDEVGALVADLDLWIVGYGRTSNDTNTTGVKYDAATKLISLNASELQVSRGQGQPQNCHGDSGGPALADLGRGQRIVGVVSRSFDGGGECLNGGIDTRVDAYLDWIHGKVTTGIPCGSGLSPKCASDDGDDPDGDNAGCCSTSSRGAPGSIVLALIVGALVLRRRSTARVRS